jgi:hypothetical protein
MIALDGMRHLRLLWLNRTTITGAGLMYLQDHVRLENLWLDQTSVNDANFAHPRDLSGLRHLN